MPPSQPPQQPAQRDEPSVWSALMGAGRVLARNEVARQRRLTRPRKPGEAGPKLTDYLPFYPPSK